MCCSGISAGGGSFLYWNWTGTDFGNSALQRFLSSNSNAAAGATEPPSNVLSPSAGSLSAIYVFLSTAIGTNVTITARINGVATALTLTITAGNVSGNFASPVVLAAGDRVSIATLTAAASATTCNPRVSLLAAY